MAEQKNAEALPAIDTLQSVADPPAQAGPGVNPRQSQNQQPPSTVPTSQDAHTLMAPNIHVMSEEIKAEIDDKRNKLLRLAIIQMNKGLELNAEANKKTGKEQTGKDANSKRKQKQKENNKKKGKQAQETTTQEQTQAQQNGANKTESKEAVKEMRPPPQLLGKRKADH